MTVYDRLCGFDRLNPHLTFSAFLLSHLRVMEREKITDSVLVIQTKIKLFRQWFFR
ncbi:hypothetical protein F385_1191 [Pantoea agglomerans 299R]|nr:hypothetical protein F385_1191 [Pantoea agglomerans 299R]